MPLDYLRIIETALGVGLGILAAWGVRGLLTLITLPFRGRHRQGTKAIVKEQEGGQPLESITSSSSN